MVRSRVAALTAALPVLTGALVAGAPSAQAACSVKADLPARVVVDRAHREHPVPLRSTCPDLAFAVFDIYGPDGWDDFVYYDLEADDAKDYWDVLDWMPPGTYRTVDGEAYTAAEATLPVAHDTTQVKWGARTAISATRSGSVLAFTVSASRYSPDHGRYVARSGAPVTIQSRAFGSPTWRYERRVTVGGSGLASTRITAAPGRYYRAVVPTGAKIWGATSTPIWR